MSNTEKDRAGKKGDRCVLMFSGGRDSTLAALRLHEAGCSPTLVTVTSDHLVGINRVQERLLELKRILPADTVWLHVGQPQNLFTDKTFYHKTCLPCQHAYVVVAVKVARLIGGRSIALGYASYQGDWPEQTTLATGRLKSVLNGFGIDLLLPVYDLQSKEDAISEMKRRGLSDASLEQKCVQQILNVKLNKALLMQQVTGWGSAISDSLNNLDGIELKTNQTCTLGEL